MKLLILLIVALFSPIIHGQIVEVSTFDEIDWDNLGKNKNATFCMLDGKTGELVEIRHYKNGKKHGLFLVAGKLTEHKTYYKQSNYRKGILHGYFRDQEASGFYVKGKKSGVWEYSDDAGNYEKRTYKRGLEHGAYSKTDGLITHEGSFKKGKKDGEWKIYNKGEEALLIEHYKNGELVK